MSGVVSCASEAGCALIADDEPSNRVILKALLNKMGYTILEAENGVQAVQLFVEEQPDMVLMDIMMPIMDGYEATIKIKQLAGDRFVPVIFLTALTDETALSRCIEVGGDDYLTKPYNHAILVAKIQAMERIQRLHQDLRSINSRMQRDEAIAEQVFNGAVLAGNVALDCIQTLIRPASVFSGDLLLTAFSPSQDLYVLLGDFTGHGLAAALGALPTSEVFRSMTSKGFSPQQILQAINHKLEGLLPTDMFLAAQFIKVSRSLDHITAYNCGMPDFFVLDGKSRSIKSVIRSRSLPLGITTDISFKDDVQHIRVEMGDRVLMATDGATEARNPDGKYFGIDRFKQAIAESCDSTNILDKVAHTLDAFCQGATQDDDISLAEIPLIPELLPVWDTNELSISNEGGVTDTVLHMESDSVEFQITLHGSQLRQADPVPMLINYLQETAGLKGHKRPLFTILTELFVNALDHGVLGLDSNLKLGAQGFTHYYEKREQLLEQLSGGFIQIGVRIHPLDQGGFIVMRIEDSGDGFDFDSRCDSLPDKHSLSGRGITLIKNLCDSIQYIEPGNKAEVVYRWVNQ